MIQQKIDCLQKDFILLLGKMSSDVKSKWGKMNSQQMVEHLSGFFKISTGKIYFPLTTPVEHLPKYKEFLLSEKEFRENTKAPVLPEDPLPLRKENMEEAISELKIEIGDFFDFFKNEPSKKTLHPAFGELNFEEWVRLHYKHVTHHLKQFGLLDG